jgi:hypothetical protein
MSRFICKHKKTGNAVAYGLDRFEGFFAEELDSEGEPIPGKTVKGRAAVVEYLDKNTDAPKNHIAAIVLDVDPGELPIPPLPPV